MKYVLDKSLPWAIKNTGMLLLAIVNALPEIKERLKGEQFVFYIIRAIVFSFTASYIASMIYLIIQQGEYTVKIPRP